MNHLGDKKLIILHSNLKSTVKKLTPYQKKRKKEREKRKEKEKEKKKRKEKEMG